MDARNPNRPKTVQAFEFICVAVLIFEVLLVPELTMADLLSAPLLFLIVLGVTRLKSSVARAIFTAIYGGVFAFAAYLTAEGTLKFSEMEWTGWTLAAAGVAQLALLWAPHTSRWIASGHTNPSQTVADY